MRVASVFAAAAALCGTAFASPAPAAAAVTPAPTRSIDIGTIVGRSSVATLNGNTATVQQYFGIPLAAVPTGSLRFMPPASPTKLSKPFHATSLPPACIQQFFGAENGVTGEQTQYNNPHGPPPAESEDCLYINVFAPGNANPSTQKAVMIWMFGGELQFGTGSYRWYNGSYFAGFQDVMVVTFNFRNNIFGFPGDGPGLPAAGGKQNVGLLDVRFALQWIQKNIAAFGGDPSKVTIMGESSGAWIVKQLMAYPPDPLPYRAAIMESQETNISASTKDPWTRISNTFGCGSGGASSLKCMQKIPALTLRDYLDRHNDLFNPVGDNVTCSISVADRVNNKQMANVPYISGTNADEGRVFLANSGISPTNISDSASEQFLQSFFPNQPGFWALFEPFINGYANGQYEGLGRYLTDAAFDCPLATFDNAMLQNGYTNQYRYYYTADFPNLDTFPDAGAYHSAEIPQVWGTYDFPAPSPPTQQQIALSKIMNTAWANFIKDPNSGPGFNWPKYNNGFFQSVAKFQNTGMTFTNQNEPDFFCGMFISLIAMNGY